jgi:hypothetical protein
VGREEERWRERETDICLGLSLKEKASDAANCVVLPLLSVFFPLAWNLYNNYHYYYFEETLTMDHRG